jgi:glycosyltransferase involved in cell wall biosynthesis
MSLVFCPNWTAFTRSWLRFRRQCLRRAQSVVANSPSLEELARQADGGSVTMIPNGVDTDRFSPRVDRIPRDILPLHLRGPPDSRRSDLL